MWNIEGKTVLITGGTSGIGKETAIALASMNANVIFTARDVAKGKKVLKEIIEATGNKNVEVMECDFSSFASVKKLAAAFKKKHKRLDVLINNAGTWGNEKKLSGDGIELTFQVNHLSPFLLTNLLLPLLKKSSLSRIVNVASIAHYNGHINFDDIEMKKGYSGFKAYANSKLANILFTKKLAEKLKGTKVTANCLHPGVVATGLYNNMNTLVRFAINNTMLSPKKGAETSIYLASSPEAEGATGKYFDKKKEADSSDESKDAEEAEKLWKISREYVKKYLK